MKTNIDLDFLISGLIKDKTKEQVILRILGIDLSPKVADESQDWEWHCGIEDLWWGIRFHRSRIEGSDYEVWWSDCDEVGIDDVEIREFVDDDDGGDFFDYCQTIAMNVGSSDGSIRRIGS
jgi:hypothetical protein